MLYPENIFRAYDVRGRYPDEVNEEVLAAIARAVTLHLKNKKWFGRPKIVVGHDARTTSPLFYERVLRAVEEAGGKPVGIGISTSPMLYYFVNSLRAMGGLMVTASHNPKEWNGLKVVGKRSVAIPGTEIKKLVARL